MLAFVPGFLQLVVFAAQAPKPATPARTAAPARANTDAAYKRIEAQYVRELSLIHI